MQDALTSGYYQILLLLFQNPLIRNVVSSFFLPNLRSPDVALQQCWPPGWQDTLSRHCWAAAALVKGLLGLAVLLLSVSKHALSHYHPIQPSCISLRAVYLVKYRLNLLWTLSWRCTPSAVFSSLLRERLHKVVLVTETFPWSNYPLSFSKSVLRLLILNTMAQQSSGDLSSSASHVAGLGQACTILGDGGKTALWKDKVSLGTWKAEETEPRGNTHLPLQK